MKNHASESTIIVTPDPLFYWGDKVALKYNVGMRPLTVESFSWHTLRNSWTYTLVYFLTVNEMYDIRWNGSLAVEEAFEKDLKLVSRQPKNKFAK